MGNRQTIFRYDNAPHHKKIKTFPNHKHIGEKTIAVVKEVPHIGAILEEIGQHITINISS